MSKKLLAIMLSVLMLVGLCGFGSASAADDALRFNEDGMFKIMQLNDLQDTDNPESRTLEFVKAAIAEEQPDLIVIAGDTLSDMFFGATADRIKTALEKILAPVVESNIPFLITQGNHDHDLDDVLSTAEQIAVSKSFANCYIPDDVCDPGTYFVPILASGSDKVVSGVYMMDTNNKRAEGGYAGVNASQVEWYVNKSNALKAANGGNAVPSMVFQHVPVKEIYNLLTEVEWGSNTMNAVCGTNDFRWYVLDESKMISTDSVLGEAPCSENFDNITGQYEAWLQQGDVICASFAHDHVNNFVGRTDDGIALGYNGGTGFNAYGNGGERSIRLFVLNENDLYNFDTYCRTYNEIMDADLGFQFIDLFSTGLVTYLMRIVNIFAGKIVALFM